MLRVSQTELLEIFASRLGDVLLELMAIETSGNTSQRAIRQWVRNNTVTPRRQISHAIAVTRHRQKVSQQRLANSLGLPRRVITDVERCRYCYPKVAREIAAELDDPSLNQLLDHYGW
jgi:ribosome-binding protein aMBF1 (putative translation factor)